MKTRTLLVVGALLAISGCAAQQQHTAKPVVVGGSRADGVVRVSFRRTENTQVDWGHAKQQATESCSEWGYKDARKFGGETPTVCLTPSGFWTVGCAMWRVEAEYQCLGDLEQ